MANLIDEFFKIGAKEFQFLVDEFGFKKRANKTDYGVYRLPYENGTTKVEIGFEWREQYFYALLGRRDREKTTAKGRMPRPEDEIIAFDLEDLLTLRAPGHVVSSGYFGQKLTRKDIERILHEYATALRKHGADILQGDFTIFPALEKIVRKRMRDHARG